MGFPSHLEVADWFLKANSYSQAETVIPSLIRANDANGHYSNLYHRIDEAFGNSMLSLEPGRYLFKHALIIFFAPILLKGLIG